MNSDTTEQDDYYEPRIAKGQTGWPSYSYRNLVRRVAEMEDALRHAGKHPEDCVGDNQPCVSHMAYMEQCEQIAALQAKVAELEREHEDAVTLAMKAGLSTGQADTASALMAEVLEQTGALERQRDLLGEELGKLLVRFGVMNPMPATGPELLLLCPSDDDQLPIERELAEMRDKYEPNPWKDAIREAAQTKEPK